MTKEEKARKHREYIRRYKETPEGRRKIQCRMLRNRFGITLEEYEEMLERQDGKCAICGKAESALSNAGIPGKMLAVDHDHETGRVRGLLCQRCNIGIGQFQTAQALIMAAEYLFRQNETAVAIA